MEKETHISTTVDVKEKLRFIAKKEGRTMRIVLARIIGKEYEKTKK